MRETGVFLNEFTDFIAVAHRHEHVRQHQIRVSVRNAPDRGFAVADRYNLDSALLKCEHHHFLNVCVVVRNQNPGH